MQVRTRFAPSPTGFLHVGGVRTALFSWLYARRHQGEFVLRIEDTDRERSTESSVEAILQGMNWLNLTHDQGPFYQTQRLERYLEVIGQLLDQNKAYRCTCSKERLEALRESQLNAKQKPRYDGHCRDKAIGLDQGSYVVRFKNPQQGIVSFEDKVYGMIDVSNEELDDLIILRSDGHPTYNFAVVVDDWDMQITHVIRGDDHINNTPRQINLFQALSAAVPIYAHLPMILGEDGKRLSKRHGAVSVLEFKEQGILPHALLNYLVRLGWSKGDQEIFSLDEMIQNFDLEHVSRGASRFDYEKLYWLNQHYMKHDPQITMAEQLADYFLKNKIDISKGPLLEDIIKIQVDRCKTLAEICDKSLYFYLDEINYDEEAMKKHWRPVVLAPLVALYARLKQLADQSNWNKETLQHCINDVCVEFDMGMGKVAQPLRVSVTGGTMSPSIDITLTLLGPEKVLSRLEKTIEWIKKREAAC